MVAAPLCSTAGTARADEPSPPPRPPHEAGSRLPSFQPDQQVSDGSVSVRGQRIDYQAVAGTLVVHPKGWDDADPNNPRNGAPATDENRPKDDHNPTAEARMFYVAYLRKGAKPENRPITFLYNGGPGSATVWLHMGAFGPRRVVTLDDSHDDAAPYKLINNDDSLLDASDLVFIDAPGTGFGRIAGKDKEKAFYNTDGDADAFTSFIAQFLARFGRFNSPKYLFGESYGTTRSAIVVNKLQSEKGIDFNGVMLLSQILNYNSSVDRPENNPGIDLPYVLALPTYAATAFYHHRLPQQPADLRKFLDEVEQFAVSDYQGALDAGTALDPARRDAVAEKLHAYTGLPVEYIRKAELRVNGGEFEKTLQGDRDIDTGRLDTRFSGPTMDPLGQRAEYDPQSAAISSAYISAFNDYARKQLHYGSQPNQGEDGYLEYKMSANNIRDWGFTHQLPGQSYPARGVPNVLPDLGMAMKYNPKLRIQLDQGYYDLATPYFEGVFEMRHLPIPRTLAGNVEIRQYQSGHMVYANEAALKQLHDNAADFIRRTDNLKPDTMPAAH
ncbi:S10 family peptidase [Rhizosaccharibacter radicis]|uniref:Peptidase S10 n=1 Tax=Rhizosaccharibacter radicis TaxID=2782605 RepID=A0ABT1VSS7_9PROT|nr:peptidase S10 [Acetobacteraceae bacterium KSS12]